MEGLSPVSILPGLLLTHIVAVVTEASCRWCTSSWRTAASRGNVCALGDSSIVPEARTAGS